MFDHFVDHYIIKNIFSTMITIEAHGKKTLKLLTDCLNIADIV